MPAVDYDYNYYNSGRNVNKTTSVKRATRKVDSSVLSTSNKKNTSVNVKTGMKSSRTSESTKEQIRKVMYYETPKQTTRRKAGSQDINTKVSVATNKSIKHNYNIDIPEIKKGKKVINSKNEKSEGQVKNNNYTKPAEMKLKKPEPSAAQKKKAREKAVNKVKNVLYIVVGFAVAFLICYRYSLIDEKFNQVEKKKKELATAQTVNEQIQADIDSQTDLSYIENFAKYQLGMQKPSNSQIVYVNVKKEDRILTPITIEDETANKTWLDQLYEAVMKYVNN